MPAKGRTGLFTFWLLFTRGADHRFMWSACPGMFHGRALGGRQATYRLKPVLPEQFVELCHVVRGELTGEVLAYVGGRAAVQLLQIADGGVELLQLRAIPLTVYQKRGGVRLETTAQVAQELASQVVVRVARKHHLSAA